jgi:hypothetical protein
MSALEIDDRPQPGHWGTIQPFLIARRNRSETPAAICRELVESGWDADRASRTSLQSLRQGDRHRLLYITLCWAAGLGALGLGTSAHLALSGNEEPLLLAAFITLFLVMAPLALYSGYVARTVEATEPHAIWSPTRHTLFGVLAGCVGAVGPPRPHLQRGGERTPHLGQDRRKPRSEHHGQAPPDASERTDPLGHRTRHHLRSAGQAGRMSPVAAASASNIGRVDNIVPKSSAGLGRPIR